MSDIISSLQKMNDLEISSDAALSQALFLKIGANINGLIDRNNRTVTFTQSGSWTCPNDVTRITVTGAGGGGGGGCTPLLGSPTGGGGGGGATPLTTPVTVVPGTTYPVTIGQGGLGAIYTDVNNTGGQGGSGGTTSLGTVATFLGALGSGGPNAPNAAVSPRLSMTNGGVPGANGGASITSLGGPTGTSAGGGFPGGGGGAGVGVGGIGASAANTTVSGNGTNGGISAGGGGGAYTGDQKTGSNGGNGGPGYLVIAY